MDLNNPKDLMTFLKVASLVLGSLSAVWALTQKFTYDDAAGVKRLTLPGMVSLALIACSLVVGATTVGFEALIRQADEARAAEQSRIAALEKKQEEHQSALRYANIRADAANQRFLNLQIADATRIRDFKIAAEASAAAALNLARANRILTEVGRTQQPLDTPRLFVIWEYPGPLKVDAALRARIDAAAATKGDFDARERLEREIGRFSVHEGWGGSTVVRGPGGTFHASREGAYAQYLTGMSGVTIAIFAGAKAELVLKMLREQPQELDVRSLVEAADYGFSVDPVDRTTMQYVNDVEYELPDGTMRSSFAMGASPQGIRKSGAIVSMQDLEKAVLVAIPSQYFGDEEREVRRKLSLYNLDLGVSGRNFRFGGSRDIQRVMIGDGEPVFLIKRIGGEP